MSTRRAVLGWAGAIGAGAAWPAWGADDLWPLWRAYRARFVQHDGRVIDDQHGTRYTTSEGQAYTLFFALVANDRPAFDTLLAWTERHLAGGDLTARLPGWRWGRHDDGRWALIDANPAADADLWLACTLLDAARLWREPRYRDLADALVRRIREHEVVDLPALGAMLLPAPAGFQLGPQRWRFNPSYVPIHQMRALALHDPGGPWAAVARNTVAMLGAVAPRGFAPDWVNFSPAAGWHADAQAESPAEGSYDAIRVYLWAGLLHPADAFRRVLLQHLRGPRDWLRANPQAVLPQRFRTDMRTDTRTDLRTDTRAAHGAAPPGYAGALLPYLQALGEPALLERQRERLRGVASESVPAEDRNVPAVVTAADRPNYYDQALIVFGLGALQGRYRFDREGALHPAWARPNAAGRS